MNQPEHVHVQEVHIEQDPIPQLLGNMEKVAGNVAYHWLMYGKPGAKKALKYIVVYGLTLDYDKTTAYTYKLTMNFEKRASNFLYGESPLHLEDGLNRFVSTLEANRSK